jgi:hypothetical protein
LLLQPAQRELGGDRRVERAQELARARDLRAPSQRVTLAQPIDRRQDDALAGERGERPDGRRLRRLRL